MVCLLVDTSHLSAFLALYRLSPDKQISCLGVEEWSGVSHSSYISIAFDKVLTKSGLSPKDIEGLFLGEGPGRFTGLRVAFSFMKVLSYTRKLPVHLCSSLRLWAQPMLKSGGKPVLVLINAFKNSVFTACYKKERSGKVLELISPCLRSPEHFVLPEKESGFFCVGNAFSIYEKEISSQVKKCLETKPDVVLKAQSLAQVIKEENLPQADWKHLKPLYLREPVERKQ